MAGRERLLDPTGDSERAADTTLAPRLSSLRALTARLLDNTKPNAATLLGGVAAELRRAQAAGRGAVHQELLRHSRRGQPDPADPAQLRLRGGGHR